MLSVVLSSLIAASPAADHSNIAWVHDDAPRAFAQAKKAKKLVAVDVWATWCHTCLMMKNFVLTERPMAKVAAQHVFLSLEYESEKNTKFFEDFPINAFPTFLVIDPESNEVVARWVGSGTSDQMAGFFASADPRDARPTTRAQRLIAQGEYTKAIALLEAEIPKAKTREAKNAVFAPYIEALWKHDEKACAEKGARYLDAFDDTKAAGIDAMLLLSYCASSLDDAAKKPLFARIAKRLERVANKPPKALEADEVAGVLLGLADLYDGLDAKEKGDAVVKKAATVLEAAAKKAPSIEARSTYDYHRLLAYLRLGRYAEALEMLSASEKAMPEDFNHPHRIALVYAEQGEIEKGLAAIERALEIGYGGRRLRIHATKIDLLLKANRIDDAEKQVKAARADLATMNRAIARQSWIDGIEARAKKIEAARNRG